MLTQSMVLNGLFLCLHWVQCLMGCLGVYKRCNVGQGVFGRLPNQKCRYVSL